MKTLFRLSLRIVLVALTICGPLNNCLMANAENPSGGSLALGHLGDFNLIDPTNNIQVVVEEGSPLLLEFSWSRSDSALTYMWMADLPNGDFSNPLLAIRSDADGYATTYSIYSGTLDAIVEQYGIKKGQSMDLIWTVFAYDGADSIKAIETWNITISRYTDPPAAFQLLSPANASIIALMNDSVVNYRFAWNASEGADYYKLKIDGATGSFKQPLLTIEEGFESDTSVLLSNTALDSFLALIGLAPGNSVNLKWTVLAFNQFDSVLATQAFTISLTRFPSSGTGLSNSNGLKAINAYPNPVSNTLTIHHPEPGTLADFVIYDLIGNQIVNLSSEDSHVLINLDQLESGTYLLRINNDKVYHSTRIVKQ